ncbi:hypothetical protein [Deinococcus hopiensis]|uniref:Lipoprotein n=1 Tax=Deinococcus hopiensis KR-140 TaxID=695939 RepID=A0A1W1VIE3_9DEIO|nr:hypothetical protein [Deinococcus hopiensis]SMB93096.1 hypothetical protein SAMN00790413_01842 [Deinococcus hopiensis KR-140]
MRRLLSLPLLLLPLSLGACTPAMNSQPVQVFEGTGRVLLREQRYRLVFTVDPKTHELNGTLENQTSKDRFEAQGTLLPVSAEEAELTVRVAVGNSLTLNASVLGFGINGVSLKSDALLTGRVVGEVFTGNLLVNRVPYRVTLRRVR